MAKRFVEGGEWSDSLVMMLCGGPLAARKPVTNELDVVAEGERCSKPRAVVVECLAAVKPVTSALYPHDEHVKLYKGWEISLKMTVRMVQRVHCSTNVLVRSKHVRKDSWAVFRRSV